MWLLCAPIVTASVLVAMYHPICKAFVFQWLLQTCDSILHERVSTTGWNEINWCAELVAENIQVTYITVHTVHYTVESVVQDRQLWTS